MLVAASKTAELIRTEWPEGSVIPVIVKIHNGGRVEILVEAYHKHCRLHVDAEPLDEFNLRPVASGRGPP